jgi:hypothetical protein
MKRSDMMRCPNCSFLNPDDADECKICGYELTPDPASEPPKRTKRSFDDDDEDLDKTVDALFGEMPAQKKPKEKSTVKRVDKRFEAYAEMPDADDEPISEDELRWLERLQRDIKQVDDEFDRMRRKNSTPTVSEPDHRTEKVSVVNNATSASSQDDDSAHIKKPSETDYLSEEASPDLAEDTKVFKGEQTFDTHKFRPTIIEVDTETTAPNTAERIETGAHFNSRASYTQTDKTIASHKPDVLDQDVLDQNEVLEETDVMEKADGHEENTAADIFNETAKSNDVKKAFKPVSSEAEITSDSVDNFDESQIHPQEHHHTVDGEEVIHLNFTVSEATGEEMPKARNHREMAEDAPIAYEALDEDPRVNPNAHRNRMIIFAVLAVILIIIFLKMFIRTTPEEPAEPINATPTVTAPAEKPSSSAAIAEQTGIFFGQLQSYVNGGNIAVLSMFEDSQNALEQLAAFKAIGTLDDFTLSMPETIDVTDSKADVSVTVNLSRTIDGTSVQSDSTWAFSWEEVEDIWRINTLVISSQEGSTTVNNNGTTQNPAQNTSSGGSSTATTTTAEKPEGFIATGTFSGGIVTDGQDVSGIRFGKHELFERVVLDLSVWTGGTPTERVDEACHYEAKISDDGKSVILTLSGARGVSAGTPDLSRSTFFKSVEASFPEDDSTVSFTILLNQASEYKVFQLKSPGKIVVDVMPK